MPAQRRRWIIGIIGVVLSLGICLLFAFVIQAKRSHELAQVISHAHLVTKFLEVYVRDHGSFPKTLEAMVESGDMQASLLKAPWGASLSYVCPAPSAPANTEVLVLKYRENRVVVTKDFTRTLNR